MTKRERIGFDLQALVRPNIWKLKPYRCARDDYDTGILLDANENSFGPPVENTDVLERYPCPYQWDLKQKVADLRGIKKEQVFVGVGSDEAIDMLIRIFCVPAKDKILQCSPTYGMYSVSAETNDVGLVDVPLTPEFQLDTAKIIETSVADSSITMMFLCSPGNPTCVTLRKVDILEILHSDFAGIVVVDEAYVDFAGPEASCCDLVAQYPQLVVLQTMSKAFGLAGIRCGFAMSQEDTISVLNKVKAPYNMNKLTSKVALDAFDHLPVFNEHIREVLDEKRRLRAALEGMTGIVTKVLESDTNFFMFQLDKAEQVYKQMADDGVVVRYRGNCLHCEGCLRVTVGTPEENTKFLQLLRTTYAALH